jgi:hypothetical protein
VVGVKHGLGPHRPHTFAPTGYCIETGCAGHMCVIGDAGHWPQHEGTGSRKGRVLYVRCMKAGFSCLQWFVFFMFQRIPLQIPEVEARERSVTAL